MGVLAMVAAFVLVKQGRYDPSLLVPRGAPGPQGVKTEAVEKGRIDLAAIAPDVMAALGGAESFDQRTLSDKIDGKAELYLSAGFVSLQCQRFGLKDDPGAWMEVFMYDMGDLPQAFSVYSLQKRPEGRPTDLAAYSYRTQNGLFLVHGRYYVEVVASRPGGELMDAVIAWGRGLVLSTSVEEKELAEPALFPEAHFQEGTVVLFIANAFGFERLDHVFAAQYELDGARVTGFLARRSSAAEARDLTEAYADFLVQNGGSPASAGVQLAGAKMVDLYGAFELVFSHGPYVAGVHEAGTAHTAERLAGMLKERLASHVVTE